MYVSAQNSCPMEPLVKVKNLSKSFESSGEIVKRYKGHTQPSQFAKKGHRGEQLEYEQADDLMLKYDLLRRLMIKIPVS